jgi:hypothetical protein
MCPRQISSRRFRRSSSTVAGADARTVRTRVKPTPHARSSTTPTCGSEAPYEAKVAAGRNDRGSQPNVRGLALDRGATAKPCSVFTRIAEISCSSLWSLPSNRLQACRQGCGVDRLRQELFADDTLHLRFCTRQFRTPRGEDFEQFHSFGPASVGRRAPCFHVDAGYQQGRWATRR